jgi:hypothetical protein
MRAAVLPVIMTATMGCRSTAALAPSATPRVRLEIHLADQIAVGAVRTLMQTSRSPLATESSKHGAHRLDADPAGASLRRVGVRSGRSSKAPSGREEGGQGAFEVWTGSPAGRNTLPDVDGRGPRSKERGPRWG